MFSLSDGRVMRGPATRREPAFDARIRDERIEIRPRP
jgi:nitrite reductase/ring-hydroxylating ferredoxin subunit